MNEPTLATQQETEELTQVWKELLPPSNDMADLPTQAMPTVQTEQKKKLRKIILIPLDPPEWML